MTKKVFLFLLAVVFTASYTQAQFTFGVRAGFNLTNMTAEIDTKMKPGFQIGVVGDYAISDNFSIQPGVLFATQGCRFSFTEDIFYRFSPMGGKSPMETETSVSVNVNYLQIPVNAQYKIALGGMKLLLQAGPYLGYALNAKGIAESEGSKEEEKMKFGSKDDEMRAFDFGLGFGAGLQFGNIQTGLGYNVGLANLINIDNTSMKNSGLAFTITYLFGK